MAKVYRVVAHEIDTETGEEREVLNDEYEGFTLYGDCGDKFAEVMIHENVLGLASKLAQGSKSKIAVKLAHVLDMTKASYMGDLEDELAGLIGGMADGADS